MAVKVGQPPYRECSTRGDRRFSAFCAIVDGKSIETIYQSAKRFADGSSGLDWRKAKGKIPINVEEVHTLYKNLWRQYLREHPELMDVLKTSSGLSDMFGQVGHICQAEVLWELRNEALAKDLGA